MVSVPAFPAMVMSKSPVGVVPVVVTVNVVAQEVDGVHEVGENDAVAPEGKPVTSEGEKKTVCAMPAIFVIVMRFPTELP